MVLSTLPIANFKELLMTEMDEISARLTVLETIMQQLITHMAVRADDPPRWVQTRRVLAARALDADNHSLRQTALIRDAISLVFDQVEHVAQDYTAQGGTPRALAR
jgi:hypothetical protein